MKNAIMVLVVFGACTAALGEVCVWVYVPGGNDLPDCNTMTVCEEQGNVYKIPVGRRVTIIVSSDTADEDWMGAIVMEEE